MRLKKLVTVTASPSRKAASTHTLVARSSAITAAASQSHRHHAWGAVRGGLSAKSFTALGKAARLAAAEQVGHAAAAQRGMRWIGADVGPPMPAAVAFLMRARRDLDRELATLGHRRGRRDRHEAQVVAERSQRLVL